ncbi:YtxH domain-containing protein [Nonomuraea mesophila]|uniref:YtxH domain-containing protein n=1 Tax=Nonomuraea mesophila TaxID=2530382 RepID=A0A4V6PGK7_9ACTN|nr:YtxH domain-containing protein [Nonomuraea mesophila]TDE55642.1 YtxH domain-containing protein [Nonomuraea mesophila]
MSLTMRKRRVVMEVPATWMGRMKAQAVATGHRMAPMADQAKVVTARRIEDARYWAAPRLESAAHGVEEQLAPKVSHMLTTAARRIDPKPERSRRWPMLMLLTGLAVGSIGYMFYRRNAQQWTEHMKDSASDASRWVNENANTAAESADRMAAKASDKADEAARKMP